MNLAEVITSVERRRHWTKEETQAMVCVAQSVSSVTRKDGILQNQLFEWRRLIQEGTLVAAAPDEPVVPLSEVKALRAQIIQLEFLLGGKTKRDYSDVYQAHYALSLMRIPSDDYNQNAPHKGLGMLSPPEDRQLG